jgi:hypothetical protein
MLQPGSPWIYNMNRYCGRDFSEPEMELIRRLIEIRPDLGRLKLSKFVCEQINWRKPNGGLKDMSCRVAMLRMHQDGLITLPPPKTRNGGGNRKPQITSDTNPPLSAIELKDLKAVNISPVEDAFQSRLWNEYIHRYHYLGYSPLPGAQIRYFARYNEQPVALLGFGSAAWKVAPRDRFIGWDDDIRQCRLHLVVNNARFLILPWIYRKFLASRILSLASKRLADDWQKRYSYRPVLVETYVQEDRFEGTCYKAANFICVGKTQGRGKLDSLRQQSLPIKRIMVKPLHRNFRKILCSSKLLPVSYGSVHDT